MLKNHLLSSLRNLYKQKLYSLLNILGLSVALATVILIFLHVKHELSYDRFHENIDNLYRVEENQIYNNKLYHVNVTPWPAGPVWQEEIPEIAMVSRFASPGSILMRHGEKAFYEKNVYSADSSFFNMFSFELIEGSSTNALSEPNSMVISRETAMKYFGEIHNIAGKSVLVNNENTFNITGVFENVPDNSSLNFDILLSFDYMVNSPWYTENWGSNSISTYLLLSNETDILEVNRKLTEIVNAHKGENTIDFMAAPLKRMHLYSYFGFDKNQMGIKTVLLFIPVGLFVLIIAAINFMNLSTAKSSARSGEIAIRKIYGARKNQLRIQFLGESMIMVLVSVIISFILVLVSLPVFNQLTGKQFSANSLADPVIISGIIILTHVTGILSGFYPALVLSSLKPLNILKTNHYRLSGKGWFRRITVTLQFSLGIILIIATVIIYQQLKFMQNKEVGYDKNNLLYMRMRGELKDSYNSIREELKRMPEVSFVSASMHPPYFIGSNSSGFHWEGKDPEMDLLVSFSGVDFDYAEAMGIKMKSGRTFSEDFGTDYYRDTLGAFMINEELEKVMEIDNAVGTEVSFNGISGNVIGVMKNYHFKPVRNIIEPLAVTISPPAYKNFLIIRLKEGDLTSHLQKLQDSWNQIVPLYPFDFKFVDQDFEKMYNFEERMSRLMKILTVIALIIAGIGLFGLSAFSAEQKTKEIGIRKALGASRSNILSLFSREFVVLLIISALVSFPPAYYFLRSWLMEFDYHVSLSGWIFVGAAFFSLLIAMISISYQALKAAGRNPADTLRYE